MRKAYCLVPDRFEDGRHDAIRQGLRSSDFHVITNRPTDSQLSSLSPDDVLVTWNTYGNNASLAQKFNQFIVCEEAYIRRVDGEKYFAIGLNGHNGRGHNPIGNNNRWLDWGIEVKPWRKEGNHILVCGQRGFGYNKMAMPDDWPDKIFHRLKSLTNRPLLFRAHPKRRRRMPTVSYDKITDFEKPIEKDLEDCWAIVTFTSNAATNALLQGIPAFFCGPTLVTKSVSQQHLEYIETPVYNNRLPAFVRLSWSQFSMSEIAEGYPFKRLLK